VERNIQKASELALTNCREKEHTQIQAKHKSEEIKIFKCKVHSLQAVDV
jgi:hypothetical protein